MPVKTTLFFSYARDDDESFVKNLYENLCRRGFNVWWDREAMKSRGVTFTQEILDAISAIERVVLIIGPASTKSNYVQWEWKWALKVGKPVVPVLRIGDYSLLPQELKDYHCVDFSKTRSFGEAMKELVRILNEPVASFGKLFGVPSLPPHFLPRPKELRLIKESLLSEVINPVVVTGTPRKVGVQGMGGIGKSILAAALAWDPEVRFAFPDGIKWITLGQEPDLVESQSQIELNLGSDSHFFKNVEEGKCRLGELLADKAFLLILDDVWEYETAKAFDMLGPRCRMVITTRDSKLITALGAAEYRLDVLSDEQALLLLADWAGYEFDLLPSQAYNVARECENLPLALALCGVQIRDGLPWIDLLNALREADIEFLDHPHGSVMKSLKISIDALSKNQSRLYLALAVFPADEAIPELTILNFWCHISDLNERNARKLLVTLECKAMLRLEGEAPQRMMSMHDLQHDYLHAIQGDVTDLHNKLLEAYQLKCPNGWHTGPNDGYFFQHLAYHLIKIEAWDELETTLCDLRFIEVKCAAGMIYDLVSDFNRSLKAMPKEDRAKRTEQKRRERIVQYTTELINYARACSKFWDSHVLGTGGQVFATLQSIAQPETIRSVELHKPEGIRQNIERIRHTPSPMERIKLFSQFVNSSAHHLAQFGKWPLFCFQQAYDHADSGPVVDQAERIIREEKSRPFILLSNGFRPSFNPDPICIRILEGHSAVVETVSVTPDGLRAVSGGGWREGYADYTVRLWDMGSGECLRVLKGHKENVFSISVTADGLKALSGSSDETLRLWDLNTGECLRVLTGHTATVRSVSMTPDGSRALSGGSMYDSTVRVWDLRNGECVHVLEGHTDGVYSVSITPDGCKAVSASYDLRVWDLVSGDCLRVLKGYAGVLHSVSITPDGKIAVTGGGYGEDYTVRVWDLESSKCVRVLTGHSGDVKSVSITPDGRRAVSGSEDLTTRVWDLRSGKCLYLMQGHSKEVNSVDITPDGCWAVSGSTDKTIRVWNLSEGVLLKAPPGHEQTVNVVSITPDGHYAVTGSYDNTIRMWDLNDGECLQVIDTRPDSVQTLTMIPGQPRIVSGGDNEEKTLHIWDLKTGKHLQTLEGHKMLSTAVAATPDGARLVSGGSYHLGTIDCTVRIWDLEKGECLRVLEGHSNTVECLCVTLDGVHAVSGASDGTLRVWNLRSGECLHVLEGHTSIVISVVVTPDGRLIVSGSLDKTIRVWSLDSGECLKVLEGHSYYLGGVRITSCGRRVLSHTIDFDKNTDFTLRTWNLGSGECLRVLEGHSDSIIDVSLSPDNKFCLTGGKDKTIRAWDLDNGLCFALFRTDSEVSCISTIVPNAPFVIGTAGGAVVGLSLRNFRSGLPFHTARRIWLYSNGTAKGRWHEEITTSCLYCGRRFVPPYMVLDTIAGITMNTQLSYDQSPCIELPVEAWDEPGLKSECPLCHNPLRFNPFIVDNMSRY